MVSFYSHLRKKVAQELGIPDGDGRMAGRKMRDFIQAIRRQVASGTPVSLPGLGTFSLATIPARVVRSMPNNGKSGKALPVNIYVPAHFTLKFKPSKKLKDLLATIPSTAPVPHRRRNHRNSEQSKATINPAVHQKPVYGLLLGAHNDNRPVV